MECDAASYTNWRFGGTYRLHLRGEKNQQAANKINSRSLLQLLVTANVIPSSPILFSLKMEAIRSSERRFLQEPHGVTA
jgi:hypothetical protein